MVQHTFNDKDICMIDATLTATDQSYFLIYTDFLCTTGASNRYAKVPVMEVACR